MKFIFAILFTLVFNSLSAQPGDEMLIRKAMKEQTEAWNRGDIRGFMSAYWQNDSLMFIVKSGITYGWQNTLNNYLKAYPDRETMGKLSFDIIHVKRLSVIYFTVVGKWKLERTQNKGDVEGYFTLLFKRVKDKWVIVSDHTS